jgi:hypothetical protein
MDKTTRGLERLSDNSYPDAQRVGAHLVIDKKDWVPGKHPEPHLREEGQTGYWESYLKCIDCGVEVLSKRDLPESCEGQR